MLSCVCATILPGTVYRFVVAWLPHTAAHNAPLDVVANQLFGITRSLPGHNHRGVCVSGGDNFPWGWWDICRPECLFIMLLVWSVGGLGVCILTKLVADGGGFGGVRRLAHAGGVAAADAEAVGLSLGQIKQRKSWRFHRDLRVHPLPAVCAWHTLTSRCAPVCQGCIKALF